MLMMRNSEIARRREVIRKSGSLVLTMDETSKTSTKEDTNDILHQYTSISILKDLEHLLDADDA
jgi:hypothetical protein